MWGQIKPPAGRQVGNPGLWSRVFSCTPCGKAKYPEGALYPWLETTLRYVLAYLFKVLEYEVGSIVLLITFYNVYCLKVL